MVANTVLSQLKRGSAGPVEASALVTNMTRPNGLAFNQDETLLYVANSDPQVLKCFSCMSV
jgi:sugar lactone lactonase YvrE